MIFQAKKVLKIASGYALKRILFSSSPSIKVNLILMYHRVLPSLPGGYSEPGLALKATTFEMHLEQVSKVFNLVSLKTFIQRMNQEKGLCAITFDDAWIDTYEVAFPILKKFRAPATVFVPTGLVGKRHCFWFDNLTTLANLSVKKNTLSQFLQFFAHLFPDWKPLRLTNSSICELISYMKILPSNKLDEIISSAYASIGIAEENSRTMIDWEHMGEMGRFEISFAPHGSHHYILPTLSSEMKMEEIFKPIQVLIEKGINTVPVFSYPNGSWDDESMRLVDMAHYKAAVTTRLGYNNQRTNPLLLNRIGLHEFTSNTPSLFWFRIFQAVIAGQGSNIRAEEKWGISSLK